MGRDWWRDPSWWRDDAWKYGAFALLVAVLVIVGRAISLDYPLDSKGVQEWVGALSGWVGAGAAAVTLWVLERQHSSVRADVQRAIRREIQTKIDALSALGHFAALCAERADDIHSDLGHAHQVRPRTKVPSFAGSIAERLIVNAPIEAIRFTETLLVALREWESFVAENSLLTGAMNGHVNRIEIVILAAQDLQKVASFETQKLMQETG